MVEKDDLNKTESVFFGRVRVILDLLVNEELSAYEISQESKININDVHSYLNQLHEQRKIKVLTSYKLFKYKKI
ncbi:hypothetical protein LCGC14_0748370 [marine sediment metagenome]|uniref:HTH arsR-type domain-containing protein n=1 Tax=marine sediment metagenome TaxID=412755 RepID=A0A0F9Q8W9_9ZZZZ